MSKSTTHSKPFLEFYTLKVYWENSYNLMVEKVSVGPHEIIKIQSTYRISKILTPLDA